MNKRRLDQIEIIERSILEEDNLSTNYVIIDSDELNKTFRISLQDLESLLLRG